jgi:hypothetical protein
MLSAYSYSGASSEASLFRKFYTIVYVAHSDKHTSFLHGGINCLSKKFYEKALELFGCVRRFSFGLAAIEGREGWGCHGRKGGGGCSFYLATKSAKRDF